MLYEVITHRRQHGYRGGASGPGRGSLRPRQGQEAYRRVPRRPQAEEVLKFFDYGYKNGDASASALQYVTMPASVKDQVRKEWMKIKSADGKSLWK